MSPKPLTEDQVRDRIAAQIDEAGADGVLRSDVTRRYSGSTVATLVPGILDDLLLTGIYAESKSQTNGRGRIATRYTRIGSVRTTERRQPMRTTEARPLTADPGPLVVELPTAPAADWRAEPLIQITCGCGRKNTFHRDELV
jgi:hypothetical protein